MHTMQQYIVLVWFIAGGKILVYRAFIFILSIVTYRIPLHNFISIPYLQMQFYHTITIRNRLQRITVDTGHIQILQLGGTHIRMIKHRIITDSVVLNIDYRFQYRQVHNLHAVTTMSVLRNQSVFVYSCCNGSLTMLTILIRSGTITPKNIVLIYRRLPYLQLQLDDTVTTMYRRNGVSIQTRFFQIL